MTVSIFGIRHHGVGSARSLRNALSEMSPDIILIEGPPEANEIIPFAKNPLMIPPTAILVYSEDEPNKAVFYPFAEFSPEWQAIKFGLLNAVETRFIDLPPSIRLAKIEEEKEINAEEISPIRRNPFQIIAEAAGFSDSEIWWENLVETRQNETEIFQGILEIMTALREEMDKEGENDGDVKEDILREAYMREEIRRAEKEGFQKIAVVCGALHSPRLENFSDAKTDAEILKNLPEIKLRATWIPFTYSRLSSFSGYGAGIHSPEFYHQIWQNPQNIAANWLSRVAHLLREKDLEASSANVIEAVRLAESLAAIRGLSAVGLNELNDAVKSVMCFGGDDEIQFIAEKLIVGDRIGEVPEDVPAVPLRQDLSRWQKKLRLAPEAVRKVIELDLRKPNDLEKSQLLHRLNLLGINWGQAERVSGKGTFKEMWGLQWHPEFEIAIVEANLWGNTIFEAATNFVQQKAGKANSLKELTEIVGDVLLANLPSAIEVLMHQIEAKTALSNDVPAMLDAFPPLAEVARYGNVRKTDTESIQKVINGLVARICVGLTNACTSLNDEASEQMFERLVRADNAFSILQNSELSSEWLESLEKLAEAKNIHGLSSGKTVRILFERKELDAVEVARRLSLNLSPANKPSDSGAWLEGFLKGSGLILLYNESLLKILDDWVSSLKEDVFVQLLPILRRTFSSFNPPERRKIGEKVKTGISSDKFVETQAVIGNIDTKRAEKVLPVMAQLLGINLDE